LITERLKPNTGILLELLTFKYEKLQDTAKMQWADFRTDIFNKDDC